MRTCPCPETMYRDMEFLDGRWLHRICELTLPASGYCPPNPQHGEWFYGPVYHQWIKRDYERGARFEWQK